jgi:alpha-1,2-mannosyltransferase
MPKRAWLWPLLLAVLVGGSYWFGFRADKGGERELPVYLAGGERMAQGAEIYRRSPGPGYEVDGKPFTYPPFAAVPFVPMRHVAKEWQPAVWFAVNFVILVLLARWLHRHASGSRPGLAPPRLVWFWVLTAVFGGRHVASVLGNQSHDLLVCGLVGMTAAAWVAGRNSAAVWAGLGGAMKATPLLFIGLFGVRWRWIAVLLLPFVFVAASLLPDWLYPRADGGSWLRAWYDLNLRGLQVGGAASAAGAWNSHSILNQGLGGTLVRLFQPVQVADSVFVLGQPGDVLCCALPTTLFRIVQIVLQLGVLAVIAFGVRCAGRAVAAAKDPVAVQRALGLGEVAAIACGMVLLSPQSSKSHFCVWLFPVAFVAERLLRGRRDLVAWALFGSAAVVGLVAKDLLGKQLGNLLLAFGNVTWATLLLLLATVRCLATARRTDVAS